MKKDRLVYMVLLIVVLLFLVWIYATNFVIQGTNVTREGQYIGVIDDDANGKITADSILKGEDAVLMTGANWPKDKPTDFTKLDADRDGFITPVDPIFHYMEVLTFGEKKYTLVPIMKTGIRAIKIKNPDPVKGFMVIMADGSVRWVKARRYSTGKK